MNRVECYKTKDDVVFHKSEAAKAYDGLNEHVNTYEIQFLNCDKIVVAVAPNVAGNKEEAVRSMFPACIGDKLHVKEIRTKYNDIQCLLIDADSSTNYIEAVATWIDNERLEDCQIFKIGSLSYLSRVFGLFSTYAVK